MLFCDLSLTKECISFTDIHKIKYNTNKVKLQTAATWCHINVAVIAGWVTLKEVFKGLKYIIISISKKKKKCVCRARLHLSLDFHSFLNANANNKNITILSKVRKNIKIKYSTQKIEASMHKINIPLLCTDFSQVSSETFQDLEHISSLI
jgi:hypothetical protein